MISERNKALLIFAVVVICYFLTCNALVPPFQQCVSSETYRAGYYEAKSYWPIISSAGSIQIDCGVDLIDRHAEFFGVIAASVAAVFAFALWNTTTRQVDLSDRSMKDSKAQFEAQHRPWVGLRIEKVVEDVTIRSKTALIKVDVDVTNYGNFPASDFMMEFDTVDYHNTHTLERDVNRIIDQIKVALVSVLEKRIESPLASKTILFPGKTPWTQYVQPRLLRVNIIRGATSTVSMDFLVVGVGCYRSPVDSTVRFTTFSYVVNVAPIANIPINDLGVSEPIDKESVKFIKWPMGWTAT